MLIAVDLDHTLLNEKSELSEHTISILKKCKKLGHKIIINTIRSYTRSKDFARMIDADYINCFAGNLITNSDGNVVYFNGFNKKLASDILTAYKEICKGNAAIETMDKSYTSNPKYSSVINAEVITYDELINYDVLKFIFIPNPNGENDAVVEELAKKFNVEISWGREFHFFRLLPNNTDKWIGLKFLLELEGVHSSELMAFGDDYTDYLSLKNAGVGVKMANSRVGALDDIKLSTASNEQDGVAVFLEEYFNLKDNNTYLANNK